MKLFRLLLHVWLAVAAASSAHEDLHERIATLDDQIAAAPSAPLLIRRADLHRRHRDWDRALRDYAAAEALAPADPALAPGRAQVHLERGAPREALRVLQAMGGGPDAKGAATLLLEARALAATGESAAADAAYGNAIERLPSPRPEHFLEHAELRAVADPRDPGPALEVLERGIARLGPLVSLQRRALELERGADRLDDALARIRGLAGQASAGPEWTVAEAEILLQLRQGDAADEAARRALDRLRSLPARRRNTAGIQDLLDRAEAVVAGARADEP